MPKPRRSEYTCTPSVLIWTLCFAFPRYFDLSVKSARNAQTKTLGVYLYAVGLDLNTLHRFSALFWFVGKICAEYPNQDARSILVRCRSWFEHSALLFRVILIWWKNFAERPNWDARSTLVRCRSCLVTDFSRYFFYRQNKNYFLTFIFSFSPRSILFES